MKRSRCSTLPHRFEAFFARFGCLLALVFAAPHVSAQAYAGQRVGLFDFEILQQKSQSLTLRCRMVNTGLLQIEKEKLAEEMIVELDSAALPPLLRGHEGAVAEAARRRCPNLKPGEASEGIWLNVEIAAPPQPSGGCADVVFDTAYVEQWSEGAMRLRFFLKNVGDAPAKIFSKNAETLVNVYFVSGTRLTRGSILAGSTSLQKGRDSLNGWLLPGQILESGVEISLKDRTKFAPNLALEFDSMQAVEECVRGNGVFVVDLRF
jgi:hypothetical protein